MWQHCTLYVSNTFLVLQNKNYHTYLSAIYRVESRCAIHCDQQTYHKYAIHGNVNQVSM
jgi:hypothetical protein